VAKDRGAALNTALRWMMQHAGERIAAAIGKNNGLFVVNEMLVESKFNNRLSQAWQG
jgi:hypothetical protein